VSEEPTPEEQQEFWRLQEAYFMAYDAWTRSMPPTKFEEAFREADQRAHERAREQGSNLIMIEDEDWEGPNEELYEFPDDGAPEEVQEERERLAQEALIAEHAYTVFLMEHQDKAFRVFSQEMIENAMSDDVEPLDLGDFWGEENT
jgi:hypothetical protein